MSENFSQVNRRTDGVRHGSVSGQSGFGQTSIRLPDPPRFPDRVKGDYPELVELESKWVDWRNHVQSQFPVPPPKDDSVDYSGDISSIRDSLSGLQVRVNKADSAIAGVVSELTQVESTHGVDLSEVWRKIGLLQAQITALSEISFLLTSFDSPLTTWSVEHNMNRIPSVALLNDDGTVFLSHVIATSSDVTANHAHAKTGSILLT